jgi:hypothetical protein
MIPVHIQTPSGLQYWNEITFSYHKSKANATHRAFRVECFNKYHDYAKEINNFLDDENMQKKHKMDIRDSEGWNWWKELSDKAAIMKYYSERVL